jgi:hypothetical protein
MQVGLSSQRRSESGTLAAMKTSIRLAAPLPTGVNSR